jgi:CubicO group peptidase (beta-lactamase class C family)
MLLSRRRIWFILSNECMGITRRQFAYGLLASLFSSDPLQAASKLLQEATSPGWFGAADINAAVLYVCHGPDRFIKAYGTAGTPDRVFLIASITKPIVATAAMILKDRRELALGDRVARFVPQFTGQRRDEVTIQHLLTHTAGLPDLLPQSRELFARQAGLEDFLTATCTVPLLFAPGTAVSYSNLGVLLVKEIIERITSTTLKQFLKAEVFAPLSMNASSLGLGGRPLDSTAQNQRAPGGLDPNTNYERDLGTPWGGIHSTASDLTLLLQSFASPGHGPLKVETQQEMLVNHCEDLNQPWGIGWMLASSHDSHYHMRPTWHRYGSAALFSNPERSMAFGVHCSEKTFGHYGVSGTLAWADPQRNVSMVLLSTKPVRHSRDGVLGPLSDLVSQL